MPKIKGVADHPNKDLMEDLWRNQGMRAKSIIEYLEEHNLPTVSYKALGKYGQRNWNDQENPNAEIQIEDLDFKLEEASQLGTITRISLSKTGYNISITPKLPDEEVDILKNVSKVSTRPSKKSKQVSGKVTHVIIPDTQVEPGRDIEHLCWASAYINEHVHNDTVRLIHLGDHWNMGSLSSYDKGKGYMEGRRYVADIASGNTGFEALNCELMERDFDKHFLFGNHECLDEETQAITIDGPKYWWELTKGELVLTCNDDLTEKWLPIEEIHVYDYEGEMYTHTGRTGMKVTPNHRIVGLQQSAWEKKNEANWKEHLASEYSNLCIPTATLNDKSDCEKFSDLDIRLVAWAFSDSYKTSNGQWVFYQSEPKQDRVMNLLDEAELTYKIYKRERDITQICGKQLKNPSAPNYEFHLDKESSDYINSLIDSKDYLPDYVWSWSARQVELFMDELIYTDGSVTKEGSKMLYHSRVTRTDLMDLFMRNGISCTLSEYASDYWRLNITSKSATRMETAQLKTEKYKGKVWCLTVENGRFYALANRISESGYRLTKPFLTGNSRINKAIENDIQLQGLLSTEHCDTLDWQRHDFLDVVELDGINYSHYFYNPTTSRPYGGEIDGRLKIIGRSFVMGHQQGLKFAARYVGEKQQIGIVAGSFYNHQEHYMGPQGTGYWRGIIVLHDVDNGSCENPQFISIEKLKRMYQ